MDLIFLFLSHFPVSFYPSPSPTSDHLFQDEAVRNEVDRQVFRYKHPALAELHDKYCSKSISLDRAAIVKGLKTELESLCTKTLQNRAEDDTDDLTKLMRGLRNETGSRKNTDQELDQNQQMILRSYSDYLDLSLQLVQNHRVPFKNVRDMTQSYVLNSRIQTEAAMNRKKEAEAALTACPDPQHVAQRKADMDQMCARIARLETKKRTMLNRIHAMETAVDPALLQEYRMVREDLMEKEWAAAQLKQSPM